jgi:DNA primase
VVFCFDGDNAGRKAAWRALESSLDVLADDKLVGFLFLPAEHDPDSFVRAEGAEAFRRLVAQPTTLTEFLLRELKSGTDLATAEGRAHLVHEAKPYLVKLAAAVTPAVDPCHSRAGTQPGRSRAQCGKPQPRRQPPRNRQRPAPCLERTLLTAASPPTSPVCRSN